MNRLFAVGMDFREKLLAVDTNGFAALIRNRARVKVVAVLILGRTIITIIELEPKAKRGTKNIRTWREQKISFQVRVEF